MKIKKIKRLKEFRTDYDSFLKYEGKQQVDFLIMNGYLEVFYEYEIPFVRYTQKVIDTLIAQEQTISLYQRLVRFFFTMILKYRRMIERKHKTQREI